ncbi:hypothetical protein B0H19DRAFT_1060129 [Mycena capillaripes]|nr:hypothetical protein B0H19DRAFT_1060129 [Mycena capillaripes]
MLITPPHARSQKIVATFHFKNPAIPFQSQQIFAYFLQTLLMPALLLEHCGGVTSPPRIGQGKVAVLPRFKWIPTYKNDILRTDLVYPCLNALTFAITVDKIHGPAYDFPDLVAVECSCALLDVGTVLILMPPANVAGRIAEPPNSDFLGRRGTTFVQYPTYLEYPDDTLYRGGWKYFKFHPGWTLHNMEEDLFDKQLNHQRLAEWLEDQGRRNQIDQVLKGLVINPPLSSDNLLLPPTIYQTSYQPTYYRSSPNLLLPFPAPVSEENLEIGEENSRQLEETGRKEYKFLNPDAYTLQKASSESMVEFNAMRASHPLVPHALISLDNRDFISPGENFSRHFVMVNEPTTPYYPGMVVESHGTIQGSWTLTEVKLRKGKYLYVQWDEKVQRKLAIVRMHCDCYEVPLIERAKLLAQSISLTICKSRKEFERQNFTWSVINTVEWVPAIHLSTSVAGVIFNRLETIVPALLLVAPLIVSLVTACLLQYGVHNDPNARRRSTYLFPEYSATHTQRTLTNRVQFKNYKNKFGRVWTSTLECAFIHVAALCDYYVLYAEDIRAGKRRRGTNRNIFVSNYILGWTNVYRTPKQVGSRIHQLRAATRDKKMLSLITYARVEDVQIQRIIDASGVLQLPGPCSMQDINPAIFITISSQSSEVISVLPEIQLLTPPRCIAFRTVTGRWPHTGQFQDVEPTFVLLSPLPLSLWSRIDLLKNGIVQASTWISLAPDGIHKEQYKYIVNYQQIWDKIQDSCRLINRSTEWFIAEYLFCSTEETFSYDANTSRCIQLQYTFIKSPHKNISTPSSDINNSTGDERCMDCIGCWMISTIGKSLSIQLKEPMKRYHVVYCMRKTMNRILLKYTKMYQMQFVLMTVENVNTIYSGRGENIQRDMYEYTAYYMNAIDADNVYLDGVGHHVFASNDIGTKYIRTFLWSIRTFAFFAHILCDLGTHIHEYQMGVDLSDVDTSSFKSRCSLELLHASENLMLSVASVASLTELDVHIKNRICTTIRNLNSSPIGMFSTLYGIWLGPDDNADAGLRVYIQFLLPHNQTTVAPSPICSRPLHHSIAYLLHLHLGLIRSLQIRTMHQMPRIFYTVRTILIQDYTFALLNPVDIYRTDPTFTCLYTSVVDVPHSPSTHKDVAVSTCDYREDNIVEDIVSTLIDNGHSSNTYSKDVLNEAGIETDLSMAIQGVELEDIVIVHRVLLSRVRYLESKVGNLESSDTKTGPISRCSLDNNYLVYALNRIDETVMRGLFRSSSAFHLLKCRFRVGVESEDSTPRYQSAMLCELLDRYGEEVDTVLADNAQFDCP